MSLAGPAVTDVIHLLAELIENALVFSPADTAVRVTARPAPQGCAVVVTDDGPGLDGATLAEVNDLLNDPPPAGPPAGRGGGLHAAALLAARCGARVVLRPGPRGGTAALVLLPAGLVTPTGPHPAGARPDVPARPPAGSTGPAVDGGGLPVRARHPAPAPTGLGAGDTVELPLPRAARGL